jgi:hypothetical protein
MTSSDQEHDQIQNQVKANLKLKLKPKQHKKGRQKRRRRNRQGRRNEGDDVGERSESYSPFRSRERGVQTKVEDLMAREGMYG